MTKKSTPEGRVFINDVEIDKLLMKTPKCSSWWWKIQLFAAFMESSISISTGVSISITD